MLCSTCTSSSSDLRTVCGVPRRPWFHFTFYFLLCLGCAWLWNHSFSRSHTHDPHPPTSLQLTRGVQLTQYAVHLIAPHLQSATATIIATITATITATTTATTTATARPDERSTPEYPVVWIGRQPHRAVLPLFSFLLFSPRPSSAGWTCVRTKVRLGPNPIHSRRPSRTNKLPDLPCRQTRE